MLTCIVSSYFVLHNREEEEQQPSHGTSNLILSASLTYFSEVIQNQINLDIPVSLLPSKGLVLPYPMHVLVCFLLVFLV